MSNERHERLNSNWIHIAKAQADYPQRLLRLYQRDIDPVEFLLFEKQTVQAGAIYDWSEAQSGHRKIWFAYDNRPSKDIPIGVVQLVFPQKLLEQMDKNLANSIIFM